MKEREKELFKLQKYYQALKIEVISNSNKYISFILFKISIIKLSSGTSIKIEGLNVKYPELEKYKNKKLIILDSAELEIPILYDENEEKIDNDNNSQNNENSNIDNKLSNSSNIINNLEENYPNIILLKYLKKNQIN